MNPKRGSRPSRLAGLANFVARAFPLHEEISTLKLVQERLVQIVGNGRVQPADGAPPASRSRPIHPELGFQ